MLTISHVGRDNKQIGLVRLPGRGLNIKVLVKHCPSFPPSHVHCTLFLHSCIIMIVLPCTAPSLPPCSTAQPPLVATYRDEARLNLGVGGGWDVSRACDDPPTLSVSKDTVLCYSLHLYSNL